MQTPTPTEILSVKPIDRDYYNAIIKNFIPDTIIDDHAHVYLKGFRISREIQRNATWPDRIAEDCSVEDLQATYRLLFPGKKVIPVIFGQPQVSYDLNRCNDYVEKVSRQYRYPALMLTHPEMAASALEAAIVKGGFHGSKVYLNYAPSYISDPEIRIFDFLPHHQLAVLNRHGWVVMLHLPRPGRLRDNVNLVQLLEIEEKYPQVKLIVAHVGRAYADDDVGDAFSRLSRTKNMVFDLSANVNGSVFAKLIDAVGPGRILYGTDLPVLRLRGARMVENGVYYNLVPKGLYANVAGEAHMRELEGAAAERLTFMIYEQIAAFKSAAENRGLSRQDIEDVFFNNAARLFAVKDTP